MRVSFLLPAILALSGMNFSLAETYAKAEPQAKWVYKNVNSKDISMDVFLPDGYGEEGRVFPFLIYFHGGSWDQGSPANHYPDCAYWASRGMVAASASYRLRTRDKVNVPIECLKDAKAAIRHVRANAKDLHIDPERIVVAGDSAGAMLAAASAMIDSPDTNHTNGPEVSCVANALILNCPYWKTGCSPALTPPNFIRAGLPPTIVFLGNQDQAISVESMRAFHLKLKEAGIASELHIGAGGKHGFTNGRNPHNPFFYWALELADTFLQRHGILTGNPHIEKPAGITAVSAGSTSYR